MKISIITPVLNRASVLQDALASVSQQTHVDTNHIVQDGGSDDGTVEILKNWLGKHPVRWQSAPDRGLYDAVNRGIARCQGDVVGVLGSDDTLADQSVLSDIAAILTNGHYDGVYGDLEMIDGNDRVLRHWRAGAFRRKKMRWGWMPPHPTLYLQQEVFERLGVFDDTYRIAGDYDAMLRWIWSGNIRLAYLPRVLVRMRQGGVSTGLTSGLITKAREDYRALRSNQVGGAATLIAKNLRKLGQFSAMAHGRRN